MASNNNLALPQALDTASTQRYHVKVYLITAMGFFAGGYNLFSIFNVTPLLDRLYNCDLTYPYRPGMLPYNVNNLVNFLALCGNLIGQIVFGWLGDRVGRKKVYKITLVLVVICSILSGLSLGSTQSVIGTFLFFRFCLAFGVGGTYPLSATIMSEYANKNARGKFIAAVFAMQSGGLMFACFVSMSLSYIFLKHYPTPAPAPTPTPVSNENPNFSTPTQAQFLWRITLMLGALPALLSYCLLMQMPETGRYTALIEGNAKQAAADMARVLDIELKEEADDKLSQFRASNKYPLLSSEFFRRYGRHLISTMSTSFLLGIVSYNQILTQYNISPPRANERNAIEEVYLSSRATFIVALISTIPGYWFTVYFIDTLGRVFIQLVGFSMMSILIVKMAIKYEYLNSLFIVLTFSFANFIANTTTYVLPAELFPTRFRSTCHGLSAASLKAGAIIAVVLVQPFTLGEYNINKVKRALVVLAAASILGFCFTYWLLPAETKRRSLEEISGEVGRQSPECDLVSEGCEAIG